MKKYSIVILILLFVILTIVLINTYSKKSNYEIIDKTTIEEISTAEALELFYKDDKFEYYFPSIKSEYVVVKDKEGNEINIKDALKNKIINIKGLDNANIKYYKEELKTTDVEFQFEDKNNNKYKLQFSLPSDYNYNLEETNDNNNSYSSSSDDVYFNMTLYNELNPNVFANLRVQGTIFGVCGTGLTEDKIETNHGEANVGYYDGGTYFSFISSSYNEMNLNLINSSNDSMTEYDNNSFINFYKSIKIINE